MAELKLHHFHGGLHPDEHKNESKNEGILAIPLPDKVILPLKQHIGEMNNPIVAIGDHVKKGQILAINEADVSAPVHASTSGIVTEISEFSVPHPSGMTAPCIVIETDHQDEPIECHTQLINDDEINPAELLNLLKQAGVVGLGGAVFPTSAKIASSQNTLIDTLIINGAECEPYITCDDLLMQTQAEQILRGIGWLQKIIKPKKTLIGIEKNKKQAIDAMKLALFDSDLMDTQIWTIPTLYPSGGEKQLITILTGLEVPPDKLAFDIGIICQNVGTCFSIARALDQCEPVISRIVTISGKGINRPGNYEVRLGTPIRDIIQAAGGYTNKANHLVMGGPMMGFTLPHDDLPVIKSTNAILALDENFDPQNHITQPCIRCAKCAEVCPAQLLPQQLFWFSRSQNTERLKEYHLFDCIECGCCAAVCPSHIPLVQYYRHAKGVIRHADQAQIKSDHARHRFEFREHRLAEIKRKTEEARRKKREALEAKKRREAGKKEVKDVDPIQAALLRVKQKQQAQNASKRNIDNLTAEQQRQIDEADQRRAAIKKDQD